MTRPAACVVALVALGLAVSSQAGQTPLPDRKNPSDAILFGAIPWGLPMDSVAGRLRALGYSETRGARTQDRLAASGRLFDRFATLHAQFDESGRLARWEIDIPSKGESDEYEVQRAIYDDAVTEMLAKHGRRQEAVDRFRFPHVKGDGREARGLRQGYATIRSVWSSRAKERLTVEIDRALSVQLHYESPAWRKAVDERRRKKARDL